MNASDFTEYLKEQVRNHSIYVWGAQGQKKPTITEEWIRKRERRSETRIARSRIGKKKSGKGTATCCARSTARDSGRFSF